VYGRADLAWADNAKGSNWFHATDALPGGCGRTVKLQDPQRSFIDTLREIARAALEEVSLLLARLVDTVRGIAPLLLPAPRNPSAGSKQQ
jgi:hypothetical protein